MVSFLCGVRYDALGRELTDIEIAGHRPRHESLGGLETTQYALEEQAQLLCEHPAVYDAGFAPTGPTCATSSRSRSASAPRPTASRHA